MNKSKVDCKKQIVRNTEYAKPKTVVIKLPDENANKKLEKSSKQLSKEADVPKTAEISEPKLNTALCVKKKIKEVEENKPRKFKSLSDLPKSTKIAVDEKVTRKVNFPFDQRLYKELISLQLTEKPVPQTASVSHEPVVKDRVPRLEDFYTLTQKEEHIIPVNTTISSQPVVRQFNGLRLQQVIKSWHKTQAD